MMTRRHLLRLVRLLAGQAGAVLVAFTCLAAEAASPQRVLVIHSFGRDFAPYDTIMSVFRAELAKRSTGPIALLETTLDAGRPETNGAEEEAFTAYLRARFAGSAPDLVVTVGPPAARFFLSRRDQLFASTPLVMAALDERLARGAALRANDAAVVGKVELPRLFSNIFELLPETTTIAVVIGASRLEQFWLKELQREVAPYKGRAEFLWLGDLSFEQMKARVAALPPRSAVFYGLLIVDAAGVPHERQDALVALHAAANAPIFGIFESELGKGVVGGPHSSQRRRGVQTAEAALRILSGPASTGPQINVTGFEPPVYDWRELQRWGIDFARLPAGSEVRFKPPSQWEEHRAAIVIALVVMFAQALLIAALLWQRARRRRAEHDARMLGGRLITAHEDERRRLARELHDDVTQRLAGISIEAAVLSRFSEPEARAAAERSIGSGLASLSRDVHALSYRLHPTVIEDLGLEEALRIECDRQRRLGTADVSFEAGPGLGAVRGEPALCMYRVAQEALRNSLRHAGATRIAVRLRPERGGTELTVADDGCGFDPAAARDKTSLGLASMRERIKLQGGTLQVHSQQGQGTCVSAWIPSGATA